MPVPTSKATFKDYILRKLGFPVVEINVSADQIDDCVDEAMQRFVDWHYDSTVRRVIVHQVTQAEIDTRTLTIPDEIVFVVEMLPVSGASSGAVFSDAYQFEYDAYLTINDMRGGGLSSYVMTKQTISGLQSTLNPTKVIEFSVVSNEIYIESDIHWLKEGDYVALDCYIKFDGATYENLWNNYWFKKYATAVLKYQWGMNLSKFQGVALLNGLTLDAATILSEAKDELEKLEESLQNEWSLPIGMFVG